MSLNVHDTVDENRYAGAFDLDTPRVPVSFGLLTDPLRAHPVATEARLARKGNRPASKHVLENVTGEHSSSVMRST